MKGVKTFEIVIILVFTFFLLTVLFNFLEKSLKREENKIIFFSKDEFLFRIGEFVANCFEKFKKENRKVVCYEIEYVGKNEINREEIKRSFSNLRMNIEIKFENINNKDKVFIVYSLDKIELIKIHSPLIQ